MVIPETHIKVLIVGAGPSGLMMAAQLLRNGVQPTIIDNKQGPTTHSNALVVQARSLEIYRQMGIIDGVLNNGNLVKGASFNIDGAEKARFDLTGIGLGQTPYPYLLLYQQYKNERALLEYLTLNCCPVYWDTTLLSVKHTGDKVKVQLKSAEQLSSLTCDWLVGADGAHSSVRKQLQIPFKGDTYQREFYLADVELDNNELSGDELQLFLAKKRFAGFFPMPEAKRFRIIGNLPDAIEKQDWKIDDILPTLNSTTGRSINLVDNNWFTVYRLHHRMAGKFREQRCFLIGDAAHIHSPVGGQGMNTGLQDAYNLGWKLAGVVNNHMRPSILDSYAEERMPVAKTLLHTTDRIFSLVMSRNWFTSLFRKWILPNILKFVWTKESSRGAFFKIISQTGITYRESKISLHISNTEKVKAGDRLPFLKVFDEKKQEQTDLHEWCNKPGFTLIILGKLTEPDLFSLAKWITQQYATILNFFYLPPSAKNQAVFDAFELKQNQAKSLIVRPDMHIGFINDKVDMILMDNYLQNIVGITDL